MGSPLSVDLMPELADMSPTLLELSMLPRGLLMLSPRPRLMLSTVLMAMDFPTPMVLTPDMLDMLDTLTPMVPTPMPPMPLPPPSPPMPLTPMAPMPSPPPPPRSAPPPPSPPWDSLIPPSPPSVELMPELADMSPTAPELSMSPKIFLQITIYV